ncbi:hypothetical protein D3C84_800260 [compost metagenome]
MPPDIAFAVDEGIEQFSFLARKISCVTTEMVKLTVVVHSGGRVVVIAFVVDIVIPSCAAQAKPEVLIAHAQFRKKVCSV